jgi:flagellar assembly protein FliH
MAEVRFPDLFGASLPAALAGARNLVAGANREISNLKFMAVDAVPLVVAVETPATPQVVAEDRAQQMRVMLDAAREQATAEAWQQAELEAQRRVLAERERMIEVCERFARDRQRYFAAAEEQVVRLALAIAARVLHSEAHADPMLLAATVRAALARVQEGSASVLRIPAAELSLWSGIFPVGSEPLVQVLADDRMSAGDCALETNVGRVDLGIGVQLEEIARGFSELASPHAEPIEERKR